MKVVVDTSVFIKSLFFEEKWPSRIIQEESMRNIKFIMSQETQKELCKTIIYIASQKAKENKWDIDKFLNEFKPVYSSLTNCLLRTSLVEPRKKFNISEHKPDNKFIDCAVEAKCKYIIAEDNHLLSIKEFNPTNKKGDLIKILSPYQFFIEYNALKLKNKWR